MCEERCQAGGTLDKPGEAGRMVYSIMMTVNNDNKEDRADRRKTRLATNGDQPLSPDLLCPRLLRLRLESAYS